MTFDLIRGAKWSDGEPITSKDVKWSLEVLGSNGLLFSAYTGNVTSIKTPDEHTVIIETSKPDARIVGGLWIYILPEHIWGKVPLKELTGSYQPDIPLVGSGPYMVTEFERGQITTHGAQPRVARGAARLRRDAADQVRHGRRGRARARPRRGRLHPRGPAGDVRRASASRRGSRRCGRPRTRSPARLQPLLRARTAPRRSSTRPIQDKTVRQAIAYSLDRERINEIATQGTSFVAHGLLPSFYKSFYEVPEQDYPYDPELGNQLLDDAGWVLNDDGVREKDGQVLVVRPLRALGVGVPGADGEADRRAGRGDRGPVRGQGGEHGEAHGAHGPQGRRQAGARVRHASSGAGAATRTTRASCSA